MFKKLIRIALFVFGLASIIDGGLPTISEELRVADHGTDASHDFNDSDYRVTFNDSKVDYCKISSAGYDTLKDGDVVTVRSSRLLHHCTEIKRDDGIVYKSHWWKLGCLFVGAVCIAMALYSSLDNDDDDDEGIDLSWESEVS